MLSSKEIEAVECFVLANGITYVDFKYEVLDHILTDVEERMVIGNLNFDTVFQDVQKVWEASFASTSSFWFGVLNANPKIVMQKCTKLINASMLKALLLGLTLFVGMYIVSPFFAIKSLLINNVLEVYSVICAISAVTFLYHFFYIKIKTSKTAYSYCYKRHFVCVPFYNFTMILIENAYKSSLHVPEWMTLLWLLFFIAIYCMSFAMFSKHKTYLKYHHLKIT